MRWQALRFDGNAATKVGLCGECTKHPWHPANFHVDARFHKLLVCGTYGTYIRHISGIITHHELSANPRAHVRFTSTRTKHTTVASQHAQTSHSPCSRPSTSQAYPRDIHQSHQRHHNASKPANPHAHARITNTRTKHTSVASQQVQTSPSPSKRSISQAPA